MFYSMQQQREACQYASIYGSGDCPEMDDKIHQNNNISFLGHIPHYFNTWINLVVTCSYCLIKIRSSKK